MKDKPYLEKYLQITYLTKDLYLEYMKNLQNLSRKQPNKRWAKVGHFAKDGIKEQMST
jgi:hypothetical protein